MMGCIGETAMHVPCTYFKHYDKGKSSCPFLIVAPRVACGSICHFYPPPTTETKKIEKMRKKKESIKKVRLIYTLTVISDTAVRIVLYILTVGNKC